jgi:hypothetical protein
MSVDCYFHTLRGTSHFEAVERRGWRRINLANCTIYPRFRLLPLLIPQTNLPRSTPPRPQKARVPSCCCKIRFYPTLASTLLPFHSRHDSLLNRPLHHAVRSDKRRDREKHLVPRPAQHVPEALGDEVGHGALSVRAQGVGCDAFAGAAAAFVGVAPGADVPSVSAASASVALESGCVRLCVV